MRYTLTFTFALIIGTVALSQVCELNKSVVLINRSYSGVQYDDNEYFVDNKTGVERGCVCLKGKCARKCCPLGQGLHIALKQCINLSTPFDPPVYAESTLKKGFNALKEFIFMYGRMNCSIIEKDVLRLPVLPAAKEMRLRTVRLIILDILFMNYEWLIFLIKNCRYSSGGHYDSQTYQTSFIR